MGVRRFISFIVLLPAWPFTFLAAMIDDEAEVSSIARCFVETFKHLFERA